MTTPKVEHLTPKNGRFLVAMLVGAPADRAREIRDKLAAERGILAQYHLDYESTRDFAMPRIPADVDLILLITSQLGHAKEERVLKLRHRYEREHDGARVPVVRVTHKWSRISTSLYVRFGIKRCEPLPLAVTSTAYFRAPPKRAIEPEVAAAPASVVSAPTPPIEFPAKPAATLAVAPPPAPEPAAAVTALADDAARAVAEGDLRRKFLRMDTLALLRELQARIPLVGARSILISATDVSFDFVPVASRSAPTEPRNGLGVIGAEIVGARIAGAVS